MYILRIKYISINKEGGDTVVNTRCFLTDTSGVPFTNSNNAVDYFTIRAPKSSIPLTGMLAYLQAIAVKEISKKYDVELAATASQNSDLLTLAVTDIPKLFIGLNVDGIGLASAVDLDSIISDTEILLSDTVTTEFTGNTVSPSFVLTGNLTLDSTTIDNMSSITEIETGMEITGIGLPAFASVSAIKSATEIIITQFAIATSAGVNLTFTTDSDSLYIDTLIPAIFDAKYLGYTITGTGIVENTTITEIVSSSKIKLSNSVTQAVTGGTFTLVNPFTYSFDTSTLIVDYTDLQKVVDIIDFDNL